MTREEIFAQLNEVFRAIFDDDSLVVNEETTSDNIEDWDSLEHINLVVAVERKFKIKFEMGEVMSMTNVGAMVDIIVERVK